MFTLWFRDISKETQFIVFLYVKTKAITTKSLTTKELIVSLTIAMLNEILNSK